MGCRCAVGRARALGEDEERQAGLERGDSAEQPGDGGARAAGVDGDLAGALEVPADEGDLPEALLGQDAELEGKLGEEDGRIHVTQMI